MTTKSKTSTVKNWVLKHKETGKIYPKMFYASRTDARTASKIRSLKGMYTPVKLGDGGIDPKKLKPVKKTTKPKSVVAEDVASDSFFNAFANWIFDFNNDMIPVVKQESTTMASTYHKVNTKPKLRPASSKPGCGTFGTRIK